MRQKSGEFIAYYRVGADRQGRSGLGLDALRDTVWQYLACVAGTLIQDHTEVESGKRNDRPEMDRALAACRRHKAKLVIAELDRLSRNLAFIAALMDSGVEFVACDNPHASRLTLHKVTNDYCDEASAADQRSAGRPRTDIPCDEHEHMVFLNFLCASFGTGDQRGHCTAPYFCARAKLPFVWSKSAFIPARR